MARLYRERGLHELGGLYRPRSRVGPCRTQADQDQVPPHPCRDGTRERSELMTAKGNKKIIERALASRTVEEADAVQKLIAEAIGARHQRPLGDKGNNQGILTGSGASYD